MKVEITWNWPVEELKRFTPEQDTQILAKIDQQLQTKFGGASIEGMKANQIKITKDLFAQESTLQEYDPVTI